jgi:hypothetical protein
MTDTKKEKACLDSLSAVIAKAREIDFSKDAKNAVKIGTSASNALMSTCKANNEFAKHISNLRDVDLGHCAKGIPNELLVNLFYKPTEIVVKPSSNADIKNAAFYCAGKADIDVVKTGEADTKSDDGLDL